MGIKNLLKSITPTSLKKIYWGIKLANYPESYLVKTGFIQSKISGSLTDTTQEDLPWMPYPFIDFLKERLTDKLEVFEYGSGSSTRFFAKRVHSITSVEFDREWYNLVTEKLAPFKNSEVLYQEVSKEYIEKIKTHQPDKKYDIVIVDGRERVQCALEAIKHLTPSGVVILDDSFRGKYYEAIDFYRNNGFKKLSFSGLKPGGLLLDETTVFYRSENCLGL